MHAVRRMACTCSEAYDFGQLHGYWVVLAGSGNILFQRRSNESFFLKNNGFLRGDTEFQPQV